jgi:large subunit ribosomal protein L10
MLIFQHNNLKATEWVGIRRELASALKRVDEELAKNGSEDYIGNVTKMQVVQTGIFASALQVVEFWDPKFDEASSSQSTKTSQHSASAHGLSKAAFKVARKNKKVQHGLEPLLSGPLAVLTLPAVSPQHLKAALSILAPSAPDFPAPKRKSNPGYHEPAVQNGLQKLMLLGARVEGKVFDLEGVKWVGGIQGGLDGLRAQLVAMLQGAAAGITTTLEAASKSLYLTVEGRRGMLEEEAKGTEEKKEA